MDAILIGGYFLLFGLIIAFVLYYFYRKYTRGKIIVHIFSKDRTMQRYAVRPGELNELQVGDMAFTYDETAVVYSPGFLLQEEKPTLMFFEEEPSPINVYARRSRSEKTSARELSRMMNDATVRDFVAAQQSFNPKSVFTAVIAMGICNLIATALAAAFMASGGDISSLTSSMSG